MKQTDVLIHAAGGIYRIKVVGRANFEYAPPLRDLAKGLDDVPFDKISIDLGDCAAMDSTFMGILAMLAMKTKKKNAEIEIVNASDSNIALLAGLGLKKLFSFVKRAPGEAPAASEWTAQEKNSGKMAAAETVFEAHDTLVDVSPENFQRFNKVLELTKKDLEILKKNTDQSGAEKK
jgi:anti-anti-sigma regulatory factor